MGSGEAMRLEVGFVRVQDVRLGARTAIEGRTLTIDRAELVGELERDAAFERVEVELAHPGEACRIINIHDVLEPRYRLEGPNFPGALDSMGIVGDGHTRALGQTLLVGCDLSGGHDGERPGAILDMAGPGAPYTPFAGKHVVALLCHPAAEVDVEAYRTAVTRACLKTGVHLAAAAKDVPPDETEVYELPALALNQGPPELPRVAHIFHFHSQQRITQLDEPVLYGSNVRGFMPTIVHPNEVLDGALVPTHYALTYFAQYHPIILELYRRHAKDLWFAGVVLVLGGITYQEQERDFLLAAHLAKTGLAADGVVCNKLAGGAGEIQLSRIFTRAEELGMKAAAILSGGRLIGPNVDAVVALGAGSDGGGTLELPPVERVLGGETLAANPTVQGFEAQPASGAVRVLAGRMAGVSSQTGFSLLQRIVT
jgi:glycine reductase complex component B subunit alpha and beta